MAANFIVQPPLAGRRQLSRGNAVGTFALAAFVGSARKLIVKSALTDGLAAARGVRKALEPLRAGTPKSLFTISSLHALAALGR
jgi:hypothetical protein